MAGIVLTLILSSLIAFIITTFLSIARTFQSIPNQVANGDSFRFIANVLRVVGNGFKTTLVYLVTFARVILLTLRGFYEMTRNTINDILRREHARQQAYAAARAAAAQEGAPTDPATAEEQTRQGGGSVVFGLLEGLSSSASNLAGSAASSIRTFQGNTKRYDIKSDLYENKTTNTITAELELAGCTKEDVDITVVDGVLTVTAKRDPPTIPEDVVYHVQSRIYGEGQKALKLPPGTKIDDITAKMENGLLTLSFPRLSENSGMKVKID